MSKTPSRRQPATVPEDACPNCGATMRRRQSALNWSVNGEKVRVPDITHRCCPKCRETVLALEQIEALRLGAFQAYRQKHGLLSAGEIRSIRQRHGLNQAELARLLRLGANTVSRWEAGRNVQSAAMDVLLRLIRDLPGSLDYLRGHAA